MEAVYALGVLAFICLWYLRAKVVSEAFEQWNYHCYKYISHCRMKYSEEEKPICQINENSLTRAEGVMVWLMFWKVNKNKFFDFKPDWEEIHNLYYK